MVAMVRKTSAVPLPAATCAELREHVMTEGQGVKDKTTGFGNEPDDGVIVTSNLAEDPTAIVGAPALLIEKLNALACTVKEMVVFSVSEPDVPLTVIEYGPAGVPTAVATVRKTSVVPLPAATCVELREHVLAAGHPVNDSATGFGNMPTEGVTVMSYFPEDPATMFGGPELLIEKLNALLCTVSDSEAPAFADPDVPVIVIGE
jgi:hypothetical protein